jgi:hypothetical protein
MPKRKVKSVAVMAEPAGMEEYKPCLYIDLQEEDLGILEELKVGQSVRVLVKGKVRSIHTREEKYDGEKKSSGDFSLEDFDVELVAEGEYEALSEDD